jgi:hypothetical protein
MSITYESTCAEALEDRPVIYDRYLIQGTLFNELPDPL